MLVLGQNHLALKHKTVRRLMYVSLVITALTLVLLLRTDRLDKTIQFLRKYYQAQLEEIVPQVQKKTFTEVNGTKTLLVAAYREHRTRKREVRIIAVVLRSETVPYHCLFKCQEQLQISKGVCNIHWDHFGFAYGTADIMCPLPCENATQVAVVSAATKTEDVPEFLEVQNQKEQNDFFRYNFTVCLSVMYDFTNVLQLVQTLEMVQLLGANRVVIYKTSSSPETQKILDYYTHTGLVEVIPWSMSKYLNVSRSWKPDLGPGDLHYFGQIAALNDCVYRYMYQSRYVSLQDVDEIILPLKVNSWLELLPLLENKYGADRGYKFNDKVFRNNVTLPPPISQTPLPPRSSPSWQHVPGVNILNHLYYEPIRYDSNFKIIVNPRVVFMATVHGLLESKRDLTWVDEDIAWLHHTRRPENAEVTPDQLIYSGRLLDFSSKLIPKVNTVFRESGLLRDDKL